MINNTSAYQIKREALVNEQAMNLSKLPMSTLEGLSEALGDRIYVRYRLTGKLPKRLVDEQLKVELAKSFKELTLRKTAWKSL